MTRKTRLMGGTVDISGQLWHYDRAGGYREVGGAWRGAAGRRPAISSRDHEGRDGHTAQDYSSRFTRLMSAGGMRHEKTEGDGAGARLDGRVAVGRWLAALSALWVIFRFVEL